MINEERIILMTSMQDYEDHDGKKDIAIANYFRGDYIGFQVLKGIICITIAMIILYAGFILYDLEQFMKNLYQLDLMSYAGELVRKYLIVVVAYAVINYIVYAVRYVQAKKHLKDYYGNLKKLGAMYNKEP